MMAPISPLRGSRILLVEDREPLRKLLHHTLADEGYAVTSEGDGEAARARLQGEAFDLVLTDLKLPGASGLDILRAARQMEPPVPVVVMTGFGSVQAAVEAMKLGAVDFLEKPVEIEDLLRLCASTLTAERAASAADALAPIAGDAPFQAPGCAPIVGRHPRLRAAVRLLERVAPTASTVLLLGESGTGKELFARSLHALSPRAAGPFVALNCAAIPETLIENELFGHEKGAFTGADRRREGRFEAAAGGTLLLDEIGELPLAVQAKVLRVLEERTYERVGGGATMRSEVRLVAATNRDLGAMVQAGEFRADLFFRLDVFPIELPALRDRASDLPALATHLLAALAARHRRSPPPLRQDAVALLAGQRWPGNVRELANLLERALILCEEGPLGAAQLRPLLGRPGTGTEADRVREALLASAGDKHAAANLLGISYRTLTRRVKEFDLEGFPKWRS